MVQLQKMGDLVLFDTFPHLFYFCYYWFIILFCISLYQWYSYVVCFTFDDWSVYPCWSLYWSNTFPFFECSSKLIHSSFLNYFTFLILPVEHFHSTGKKQFMRQLPCFHTQTFQSADEEGDDWAYALCERSPTFLLRKEQTLPSLPKRAILGKDHLGTS